MDLGSRAAGAPAPAGRESQREQSRRLFARLSGGDQPERQAARDALIELHLPLAEHCANRFAQRGEPREDLVQVGTIGLIKAVDRFEPERGLEFSTYAIPTIVGEIKRHFRDRGWAVRIPRRLQELRAAIAKASEDLGQSAGRAPSAAEIAEHLGIGLEDVLEAIEAGSAYTAVSLDSGQDGAPAVAETLGDPDAALDHVELRASLRPLLEGLPERERRIVALRFFEHRSQAQIAAELGISQMHVSRLLSRTLDALRAGWEEPRLG